MTPGKWAYVTDEVAFLIGTDNVVSLSTRLGYTQPMSMIRAVEHMGRFDLSVRLRKELNQYNQVEEHDEWD